MSFFGINLINPQIINFYAKNIIFILNTHYNIRELFEHLKFRINPFTKFPSMYLPFKSLIHSTRGYEWVQMVESCIIGPYIHNFDVISSQPFNIMLFMVYLTWSTNWLAYTKSFNLTYWNGRLTPQTRLLKIMITSM